MSSFKFRQPIPKHGANLDNVPAPITAGSFVCYGLLEGKYVIISNPEHIYFLNNKGNFGTFILPKRKNSVKNEKSAELNQRRMERRRKWHAEWRCDKLDKSNQTKEDTSGSFKESSEAIAIDDPYSLPELMQLDLLETFYLVHSLECLLVFNENEESLDVDTLWKIGCEKIKNFVFLYVSYSHFRRKGWVVKDGLNFGTNFLLYKFGPSYYHASYSVLVRAVTSDLATPDPNFSMDNLTWEDALDWNRITEHVSKELLICYVVRSDEINNENLIYPKCLTSFKVQLVLIKRWIPSQDRDCGEKNC